MPHDLETAVLITAPAAFALARFFTVDGIGRLGGTCWIHALIGIPCPTCGVTRAALALTHGDLHAAFAVQPLVTVVAVITAIYVPWAIGVVWLGWTPLRLELRGARGRAWRWALVVLVFANWCYLMHAGV